jgi:DNA-directed RNA polymerase specialized sigma24 family protein
MPDSTLDSVTARELRIIRVAVERMHLRWTSLRDLDADDLVQLIWMRWDRSRKSYDPDKNLSTWLNRLSLAQIADEYRRRHGSGPQRMGIAGLEDHPVPLPQNRGRYGWERTAARPEATRDSSAAIDAIGQVLEGQPLHVRSYCRGRPRYSPGVRGLIARLRQAGVSAREVQALLGRALMRQSPCLRTIRGCK